MISPSLLAISADDTLGANQSLILSLLAAFEEFLSDAGAPLTPEQKAAFTDAASTIQTGLPA